MSEAPQISSRRIWRTYRSRIVLVIIIALSTAMMTLLLYFGPNREPYSINSYKPDGSAAIANIASAHGLSFKQAESPQAAFKLAKDNTQTIVLLHPELLRPEVAEEINQLSNPIVIITKTNLGMDRLGFKMEPTTPGVSLNPDCSASVARAGQIESGLFGVIPEAGDESCYVSQSAATWVHRPATSDRGDRYVIVGLPLVENQHLAENGNASLLLSTISANGNNVIWWLGSDEELTPPINHQTPPYFTEVLFLILVLFIVSASVYGRRFGPLVSEQLPVVVPSLETVRGRASLYRRSRDYGHMAQHMRAWTLHRLASQIGLHPGSTRAEVVDLLAKATGRSESEIDSILYSNHPATLQDLNNLDKQLNQLESEATK